MEARGRRNLKKKRKSASASASASAEGADHDEDPMKRNSKKDRFPSTKPTTQEEEEEATQPAGAGKKAKEKRKRVVRERLPEGLIDIMIVHPSTVLEIPGEKLVQRSDEFILAYAERRARSEKMVADEQALIDQYLISGYAEDEREVTDDDEDDGEYMEEEIDGSKGG